MRVSDLKQEYWLSVLAISLMTILQLGCAAQQTSAQQGRETLEEAAQAMGGLDALRAIENITRQGRFRHPLFDTAGSAPRAPGCSRPVPSIKPLISPFPEKSLSGSAAALFLWRTA